MFAQGDSWREAGGVGRSVAFLAETEVRLPIANLRKGSLSEVPNIYGCVAVGGLCLRPHCLTCGTNSAKTIV